MKIKKERLIDLIYEKINNEKMELRESIEFILEFKPEEIENENI